MTLFSDNQQGLIVKSDSVRIESAFLDSCEVVHTPVGFLQPAQLVLGRAAVPLLLRAEVRAGAHLFSIAQSNNRLVQSWSSPG